ncbi:hypothetical protein CDL15_Pgr020595 [Punica granatum]|uniref:Dof zinc finger protein n=1 Tax=Punica granatum TaxID=22663 RepID=A0A218VWM9_PUNGR|nr:hypothetical protein CDL15_Pgr020595 [Punica granatum]PKI39382.1 hypothetical protein CRG98_040248 [Punica granatum]
MVFSSIPAYNLDPSNWQQLPNHQLVNTGLNNNSPSLPPPAPPAALQAHGSGGSIRPGSMTERARLANIQLPEAALKCPRCESTNTKFCYFNNYSLTQPRHFCKTCRRYWTRGGALRNVPVGGGCRRNNKKSNKSNNNRSKSPATCDHQSGGVGSTNTCTAPSSGGCSGGSADALLGLSGQMSAPLRFMAPNLLHHLGDNFGFGGGEINGLNNYGEVISLMGGAEDSNFHMTGHLGSGSGIFGGSSDPHSIGFYQFGGGSSNESLGLSGGASRVGEKMFGPGALLHLASVKLEDSQELNLSRRFLGMPGSGQHMNGALAGSAWTNRSAGFSSSSTTSNNAM